MRRTTSYTVIVAVLILGVIVWRLGVVDRFLPATRGKPPSSREWSKGVPTLFRPLVVQFPTYGGYAPGIAYNRGLDPNENSLFVKNQGIEVALKVIDAPETAVSAFVKGGSGGGVDIMSFTVDMYAASYLELKRSGLETVAILLTSWSHGGDAIVVSREITKPEDLRGKKLACAKVTPSHYYALYVLENAGLSNDDVDWVFTQTAIDAANVFKAGKVSACVSWAPDVYEAAKDREGAHILSSTKDTGRLIGDIFIAKREFAEKEVDVLARFCQGWLEGVELATAKADEAATYLAEAFKPAGVDEVAAKYLMSIVQFADKKENLAFFGVRPGAVCTYRNVYQSAGDLWKKYGVIDSVGPVEDTYLVGHLEELAKVSE